MTKLPHRTFEMFETLDETIAALTPKAARKAAVVREPIESTFKHLSVQLSGVVYHVQFNESEYSDTETEAELREDFKILSEALTNDTQIVLDFSDVESFSANCIESIATFKQKTRNKGSRIGLCCIGDTARQSFSAPARHTRSI